MKKLLLPFAFILLNVNAFAQNVEEPEFVGEAIYLKNDDSFVNLEKSLTQKRTVASTGLMMTGIGKVRQQIQIDGCCSKTLIKKNEDVKFIIRNIDNNTDPMAVIQVFKLEQKKKYRRAELSAISSLGSSKSNNLEYVSFVGKKYGQSSYLIKLSVSEPGEYGIIVSNPNTLNETQTVVSTFTIVD